MRMSMCGKANKHGQHAQRHVLGDQSLRDISIIASKAGRPRVSRCGSSGFSHHRQSKEQDHQPDSCYLVPHQPPAQANSETNLARLGRVNDLVAQRDLLEFRVLFLQQVLLQNGIAIPEIDNIGVQGMPRTISTYPLSPGSDRSHVSEQNKGKGALLADTAPKVQALGKTNSHNGTTLRPRRLQEIVAQNT
jgi:hypothetical protein